jgi:hypothetical protein
VSKNPALTLNVGGLKFDCPYMIVVAKMRLYTNIIDKNETTVIVIEKNLFSPTITLIANKSIAVSKNGIF